MAAIKIYRNWNQGIGKILLRLKLQTAAADQTHDFDCFDVLGIQNQIAVEHDAVGLKDIGQIRRSRFQRRIIRAHFIADIFARRQIHQRHAPLLRQHDHRPTAHQHLIELIAGVIANGFARGVDDHRSDVVGDAVAVVDAPNRIAAFCKQIIANFAVGFIDRLGNLRRGLHDLLHHRVVLRHHHRDFLGNKRLVFTKWAELCVTTEKTDLLAPRAIAQSGMAAIDFLGQLIHQRQQLRHGHRKRNLLLVAFGLAVKSLVQFVVDADELLRTRDQIVAELVLALEDFARLSLQRPHRKTGLVQFRPRRLDGFNALLRWIAIAFER